MSGKNVMVVEDNEKNRKLMRVVLKAKGYNVIEATTGEEALGILKDQKPDIILMDIQLPGIDGLTLVKQIKASAITKDIPIIAVTAYAMKGDEQKIMETGFLFVQNKAFPYLLWERMRCLNLGRHKAVPAWCGAIR